MRLPGFIRNLTISASLRGAFLTGALLTLVVSGVSLYSGTSRARKFAMRSTTISRGFRPRS